MVDGRMVADDSGESSVIGVVLLVAVTVLVAGVVGGYVFDLGESTKRTMPQAGFGFSSAQVELAPPGNGTWTAVTVTHDGGDVLRASNVRVTVDGAPAYTENETVGEDVVGSTFSGTIGSGDSVTVVAATTNEKFEPDNATYEYRDIDGDDLYESNGGLAITTENTGEEDLYWEPVVTNTEIESGDIVRVVWEAPGSDESVVLADYVVP